LDVAFAEHAVVQHAMRDRTAVGILDVDVVPGVWVGRRFPGAFQRQDVDAAVERPNLPKRVTRIGEDELM